MKKKFLGVMLMLIMVISLASILPASTALADVDSTSQETSSDVVELPSELLTETISTEPTPTSDSCGDNVKWAFNKDTGVLTISGTGKMDNYLFDAVDGWGGFAIAPPWCGCDIKTVNILDGVKSIGYDAFFDFSSITSVTIPKTVTEIGEYALGYVFLSDYANHNHKSVKIENFKIYCYEGTAGEQYAKDNGFEYEILSDKENPPQNQNNNTNKPNQTVNTVNKAKITPSTTKVTAPKPAKVKEVKLTAKKKKLNVSWKKVSGATGYEVMYAKNNKFTKGKKTVKVKKNKVIINRLKSKKKYFVKVRAYKKANGDTYYGKWSKVAKKKVK